MDPIEARKQKLLGSVDDARRADALKRAHVQAARIFQGGAQDVELQPSDDLEAERRALGLAPCLECAEYFLPGRSTQTVCEKCVKRRAPAATIGRARPPKWVTGYDAPAILELASSLDLIASIAVVLSTLSGAGLGVASVAQVVQRPDMSEFVAWIIVIVVGTLGALVGFALGRLNVVGIRLLGQLSRCLVEIERSVRAP